MLKIGQVDRTLGAFFPPLFIHVSLRIMVLTEKLIFIIKLQLKNTSTRSDEFSDLILKDHYPKIGEFSNSTPKGTALFHYCKAGTPIFGCNPKDRMATDSVLDSR